MKFWQYCIELGLIAIGSIALSQKSLATLPLQVGIYNGGGSRYIQIAREANRICFKGFSNNGVTVASVATDPKRQGTYKINGFDGAVLLQQDKDTLLFGEPNQLIKYVADYDFPINLDADLQQCLNSDRFFFKQKSGGRGSRSGS